MVLDLLLRGVTLAEEALPEKLGKGLAGIIVLLPSERRPDAPEFDLNPGDVTSATVETDADGRTMLLVAFSKAKREEFGQFTSTNTGKKVWVIVNGQVVSEVTIREPIYGPTMQIDAPSKKEADEAAKILMQNQKTSP
jgi:preprotein translocase subunit SecD